jgi:DNA-binding XRE family transcriptional regulator
MAREMSGYTLDEAAEYCGVSTEQMEAFEREPGEIPKNVACKIKKMYNISLDIIEIK